jgi:hypothetical protein
VYCAHAHANLGGSHYKYSNTNSLILNGRFPPPPPRHRPGIVPFIRASSVGLTHTITDYVLLPQPHLHLLKSCEVPRDSGTPTCDSTTTRPSSVCYSSTHTAYQNYIQQNAPVTQFDLTRLDYAFATGSLPLDSYVDNNSAIIHNLLHALALKHLGRSVTRSKSCDRFQESVYWAIQ